MDLDDEELEKTRDMYNKQDFNDFVRYIISKNKKLEKENKKLKKKLEQVEKLINEVIEEEIENHIPRID